MHHFKAGVQYGDFEGTAAADDGHDIGLHDFLRDKGLMDADDFLLGATLWVGENFGGKAEKPHVSVIYATAAGFDEAKADLDKGGTPILRRVDVELTLDEFVGLFKRFSVVLTKRGLDLIGREYAVEGE